MKKIVFSLIAVSFLFLGGCASNKSVPDKQFSNENFLHGLPSGWVQGFSTRKGKMVMKEFVPKGQSVNNWEEMITTQVFYGGIDRTPAEFAESMRMRWKASCPGADVFPGRTGKENGYPFAFWQQFCGNNPQTHKPEITFLKAISGNDSFYVIQKSWKRMPTKDEILIWARFLRRAMVCDSRIPEQKCPDVKN